MKVKTQRLVMREGSCLHPTICPLNQVQAGTAVRIKQLSTPPDVSHRLREMGLGEDQQIKLLTQEANIICLVCNARLALSSELAESIIVEPLPAQPRVA